LKAFDPISLLCPARSLFFAATPGCDFSTSRPSWFPLSPRFFCFARFTNPFLHKVPLLGSPLAPPSLLLLFGPKVKNDYLGAMTRSEFFFRLPFFSLFFGCQFLPFRWRLLRVKLFGRVALKFFFFSLVRTTECLFPVIFFLLRGCGIFFLVAFFYNSYYPPSNGTPTIIPARGSLPQKFLTHIAFSGSSLLLKFRPPPHIVDLNPLDNFPLPSPFSGFQFLYRSVAVFAVRPLLTSLLPPMVLLVRSFLPLESSLFLTRLVSF